MDEMRRRFMRLAVKLTEEELEKKKGELVEWTRVRAEGEHRLEARVAEMKEEKKQMEAEILRIDRQQQDEGPRRSRHADKECVLPGGRVGPVERHIEAGEPKRRADREHEHGDPAQAL